MTYDPTNIFARILRGEIPCDKIIETDHTIAFRDIAPKAPVHALVIPKGSYVSFADFSAQATDAEIIDFNRTVGKVADLLGVTGSGYRLMSNHGEHSGQEVPHYHVHILGGEPLGPMRVES